MNCDGLRWERQGRINRGEQVGDIDANDAEIICAHVCPLAWNCSDHRETFTVHVIFFADEPDSYFDSR